ncbi:O-antigen ligase family protein [Ammoniphilus sp. 3BR4]|uniref:O-antigen ligase family protein n=1 Tax=Ammoniphilus sp. 3BR4 TaxID=3158265 RepID=UPI003467BB4D
MKEQIAIQTIGREKPLYSILYAFIALFPFLIYPWGSNPSHTIPKFLYLILFTLALWMFYAVHWAVAKKAARFRIQSGEWLVFAFLLLIILSTVLSVDRSLSLWGEALRFEGLFTLFSYISLFFFSFRFIQADQQDGIFQTFLIGSFFVAFYGILQHFQLDFLPRNSIHENYTRSYGFFGNPNCFGTYLVLALLLGKTFYLKAKPPLQQMAYLGLNGMLFAALIYSSTRSGWVGVLFGGAFLTVFVVWKRRDLWRKWLLLYGSFAIIFLLINVTEQNSYAKRASTLLTDTHKVVQEDQNGRAGSGRWYIWSTSFPLIADYFWIGSGPDTFAAVFPHRPAELKENLGNPNKKVDKAHNEYLQIAITLGVPALLIYLLFIAHIFWRGMKRAAQLKSQDQILLYGLLAMMLGYLIQAFFNFSVLMVAPFFWIFLGMLYRGACERS